MEDQIIIIYKGKSWLIYDTVAAHFGLVPRQELTNDELVREVAEMNQEVAFKKMHRSLDILQKLAEIERQKREN